MTSPQDTKQGSAAWHQARLGHCTASHIGDVLAKTKSGYSASRLNYLVDLICERLTGEISEHYVSAAMTWGITQEPYAISEYELKTGNLVEPVGFVEHPTIPMSGASPDGLIGSGGLIEVKAPNTSTHIKTLLGEKIDRGYILQMHFQMDCTERSWCDFLSFDPRLPENLMLAIMRVERDEDVIKEIRSEVVSFLGDADKLEAKLRAYTEEEPASSKQIETGGAPAEQELKEGEVF